MKNVRILVAVEPADLSRVIGHLLRDRPEVDVVSFLRRGDRLLHHARRLLPNLIIVNDRWLGEQSARFIRDIKNSSPGSKLILTSWMDAMSTRRRFLGADAQVNEADLTRQLIPTLHRLASRSQNSRAPKDALTRRRNLRLLLPDKGMEV